MSAIVLSTKSRSRYTVDLLTSVLGLASELLSGKYTLPEPQDPTSLLARHEMGVWGEAISIATAITNKGGNNRNEEFNVHILPRCRALVVAKGHRMVYEAAKASCNVRPEILRLFETTCLLDDASWYVQHAGLTRQELYRRNAEAVNGAMPLLDTLLEDSGASPFAVAPILDGSRWDKFVQGLQMFGNIALESDKANL